MKKLEHQSKHATILKLLVSKVFFDNFLVPKVWKKKYT